MRRITNLLLVLALAFSLARCATTTPSAAPEGEDDAADEDGEDNCKKVYVTGSNIPETVCIDPAEAKARERNDKEEMRRLQRNTPPPTPK